MASFHTLVLKLHFCLDDWLLHCQCRVTLRRQLTLLCQAGWVVNEDKSELDPSQDFVRFRTAEGLMSPPQDRIVKIRDLVQQWRCRSSVSARELLQLLGLLNSAADQVPSGRLHMRPLQLLLLSQWRPTRTHWTGQSMSRGPLGAGLEFLGSEPRLLCGLFLAPPAPEMFMFTDVSLYGWGAMWARWICPRRARGKSDMGRYGLIIESPFPPERGISNPQNVSRHLLSGYLC
jgi:hypothetical protein